jgi:naphthalene 1,2-dioxygenase system ferredoxin subunit
VLAQENLLNYAIGLDVTGRDIALYTVGDEAYATDNLITHGKACL